MSFSDDADIAIWLRLLARRWKAVSASCAVGAVAVAALSWLFVPMFQADVVVVPVREDDGGDLSGLGGGLGGLATLAGIDVNALSGNQDEVIAYLESRELGKRFLSRYMATSSMLERRSIGFFGSRKSVPPDEQERKAYEIFDLKVRRIIVDKKVGVVRISMIWPDPEKSAEWANSYARMADEELRKRALARYDAKRDFLDRELATAQNVELREAIGRLMEGQLKLAAMSAARESFALRVVDPAVAPLRTQRISPNRVSFAILGLLVGFAVAAVWITRARG